MSLRSQLRKAVWTCERIMIAKAVLTRMYGTLHLPARLVPRPGDVASASEFPIARAIA